MGEAMTSKTKKELEIENKQLKKRVGALLESLQKSRVELNEEKQVRDKK